MKQPNEMTRAEITVELDQIAKRMAYYETHLSLMIPNWEMEATLSQQSADMQRTKVLQDYLASLPTPPTLRELFDPHVEVVMKMDFPELTDNTRIVQCDDLAPDGPGYTYKWQDGEGRWHAETSEVYKYAWASVWIVKVAYFPRTDTLLWFLSPAESDPD